MTRARLPPLVSVARARPFGCSLSSCIVAQGARCRCARLEEALGASEARLEAANEAHRKELAEVRSLLPPGVGPKAETEEDRARARLDASERRTSGLRDLLGSSERKAAAAAT